MSILQEFNILGKNVNYLHLGRLNINNYQENKKFRRKSDTITPQNVIIIQPCGEQPYKYLISHIDLLPISREFLFPASRC